MATVLIPHCCEPVGQAMQIIGEGAERADRLRVAVRSDRRHMHLGADVDGGRVGMDGGHRAAVWTACSCEPWQHLPECQNGGAGLREEINFLTGIAATASPLSSAQQPMDHVFLRDHPPPKS